MSDKVVLELIKKEYERQKNTIELIASENYPSVESSNAMASILTCKYSEGYPGKRYYGGCEVIDKIEGLAIERVCKLFGADHANVQLHSGSQANMAAYAAVLNIGDKILAPSMQAGGHLTHSAPVSFVSKQYDVHTYEVNRESFTFDYEEIEKLAMAIKPKLIIAGASAYSRKIDFKRFSEIAKKVGAILLVDMAHIAGLVATGFHESPVPYADIVTSTTHKTLRGPRGGFILCKEKYAAAVDKAVFPHYQGGALQHVIAAKAICFYEAAQPAFKEYIGKVVENANALANAMQKRGFNILTGGTDNHVFLVDLREAGITGKDAQARMDSINVTLNKNGIPFDTVSPFITSGVRIGTAAITSRGFEASEMDEVASIIEEALLKNPGEAELKNLSERAVKLCEKHPLPEYLMSK